MKTIFAFSALFALLLSVNIQARPGNLDNQSCVDVYRDGALDLLDSVEAYNKNRSDQATFSAEVTALGATIRSLRTACYFVESPEVKDCVEDYKAIYQDLRDRVRVRAVIAGNQNSVDLPFGYRLRLKGKIGVKDALCSKF